MLLKLTIFKLEAVNLEFEVFELFFDRAFLTLPMNQASLQLLNLEVWFMQLLFQTIDFLLLFSMRLLPLTQRCFKVTTNFLEACVRDLLRLVLLTTVAQISLYFFQVGLDFSVAGGQIWKPLLVLINLAHHFRDLWFFRFKFVVLLLQFFIQI